MDVLIALLIHFLTGICVCLRVLVLSRNGSYIYSLALLVVHFEIALILIVQSPGQRVKRVALRQVPYWFPCWYYNEFDHKSGEIYELFSSARIKCGSKI